MSGSPDVPNVPGACSLDEVASVCGSFWVVGCLRGRRSPEARLLEVLGETPLRPCLPHSFNFICSSAFPGYPGM
eukprot:2603585-Amphidinium_carterae.2